MPSSSLNKKLLLTYSPWKKLAALLVLTIALLLAWVGFLSNFFLLEVSLILFCAYLFWLMLDIVGISSICMYPNKIVKRSWLGETTIPTHALLVADSQDQDSVKSWRFFHGSNKNRRESIRVAGNFLSPELRLWLDSYRRNIYRLGGFSSSPLSSNSAVCVEFDKAVSSFRFMAVLTGVYLLVYVIYATMLYWQYPVFAGYAPQLPAWPVRILFVAVALAVYPLLQALAKPPVGVPNYTLLVAQAQQRAFRSALIANGVAWLGLPLFLLCGNRLDFYLLLSIGAIYHYDFYPRLSTWESILQAAQETPQVQAAVPRRSMQVSLALLGGLSLASYAGNPNDFRIRQQDCVDDKGNPVECQSNGSHGGGSGSSYRGNGSSDSHSSVRRGGFGFFGGSHSSFGG
ncbi:MULTISPECIES: hypothetical protein [Methylomonas]|uniref:Uncharacterized protein n=2 Tax=Methylomonas TaxID=416 RepID=A0A126T7Q6_9GAMM|nr:MULTISPECIES: hypothetical protein [Methylomonas]AMK78070.1 hypothetical protein JT25_016550 [Methylomonas denitrificans]OAI07633.1 hypothetical protein A1342_10090 [Methylomonas methanica]TCV85605.1 hypothetical protein EDE11_105167 [Methylomonas methanica]